MNKVLLLLFFAGCYQFIFGQNPGDTIRIKSFTYENPARDLVASFPDDPNLTYEKVLLKYSMRCKGGLISSTSSPNLGCGEWDFSNNTYLVDSTKIEEEKRLISSHFISNFEGDEFAFSESPVYNLSRSVLNIVTDVTGGFSNETQIASGTNEINRALATDNTAGRSFYLYTAQELIDAGATAGDVDGLGLNILSTNSEAGFLRIGMKHTSVNDLEGTLDTEGFQEVFHNNTAFEAAGDKDLYFTNSFVWDGVSNILMEFSFTNLNTANNFSTTVSGEETSLPMGISAVSEQDMLLTNNTYIECEDYSGITGSQNRTIEAWVRVDGETNGEIMAWGRNVTGERFTFRFVDGRLRVEVSGGGTESSTSLDDGEWHHIAAVLDGNNVNQMKFYLDGVLDPLLNSNNVPINTSDASRVRITRGLNNRYIDGSIDEIRVWNEALSEEIIANWRHRKLDVSHPNFSNLQLHYEFDGTGAAVYDSSINGRNATVIGDNIRLSVSDGARLIKEFVLQNERPSINFLQGPIGQVEREEITLDRPIVKEPRHIVITRRIEPGDPSRPINDEIIAESTRELWSPISTVFDAISGAILEENTVTQDGVINITELEYAVRFPFFNELVSFVTPYGIGLDLGPNGISWYIDMTDFIPLLKGDKRLLMTLGGQNQEEMDLEWLFIVGTPPRDVVQFEQIWQGTTRGGSASISAISDETRLGPQDVTLSPDAVQYKLRSSITGHGSAGEFGQNGGIVSHRMSFPEGFLFDWTITQECSFNPIFPQGGTWVFDRQGWCPGEQTLLTEHDLTPFAEPGETINLNYSTSAPLNPSGDYRYHVAHQVIGYGEPNFQLDAAVVEISAPNNTAQFRRVGETCANPMITIRNTGATELTSLTINYWINDAQTPQTYEWTGSLDFMEEELITIPSTRDLWFDLLNANNRFHVSIDSPNGGGDEYGFNNTMSSNFNFPDVLPSRFTIEFRTNNSPGHNSYELIDAAGNILGSNPLTVSNTNTNDDYELEDDCYTLIVRDSGGDGLQWFANPGQGTGFARIKDESGAVLRTFEPDFGGGFEYRFTTDFAVSVQDLEFIRSIAVYPNPASERVTIEAQDMFDTNVYMTDLLGRNVSAPILNKTEDSIAFDVQFLNAGVYFIVLKKDDIRTTRKLIIE